MIPAPIHLLSTASLPVTRGLDHASRIYPTCALKALELGYTEFGWSILFVRTLCEGMDCRVTSAFTRVFRRAMPGNDEA
jgi:hypothetical protein